MVRPDKTRQSATSHNYPNPITHDLFSQLSCGSIQLATAWTDEGPRVSSNAFRFDISILVCCVIMVMVRMLCDHGDDHVDDHVDEHSDLDHKPHTFHRRRVNIDDHDAGVGAILVTIQ